MEIDCGICALRAWRPGDEPSLVRHANNRAIWLKMRDRFPYPYTRADAEGWIRIASARDPQADFAIEVAGEAVGGVGLMLHEDVERVSAEIGYWLGESLWGRGIMSAAVNAVTEYAFSALGLTRVYAVPYAHNAASMRVLEKAGFAREGRMRRSAIKDGVVLDQLLFARTDLDPAPGPHA
jgi:RimJ/RimL family protein N-acetyltransferase